MLIVLFFYSYIYWSDWGTSEPNGRIERAALDGSHRKLLISKLGRPNGITIDYDEKRLYWIDLDSKKIESSDLSGKYLDDLKNIYFYVIQ